MTVDVSALPSMPTRKVNLTMKQLTLIIAFAVSAVVTAQTITKDVDLDELARNRSEWPVEVLLTERVAFPIVFGGNEVGSAELPLGTKLKLVAVLGEQLKVAHGEAVKSIPVKSTDLITRVLQLRTKRTASPAPSAATATTPKAAPASQTGNSSGQLKLSREELQAVLDKIILPSLEMRTTPVDQAIQLLITESKKADPQGFGVPIRLQADPTRLDQTITLRLKKVPLRDAIKFVTNIAGLKYVLGNGEVIVLASDDPGPLMTREYPVSPAEIYSQATEFKRFLADSGVLFPDGSSITYDRQQRRLKAVNTADNLDALERVLKQINPPSKTR